MLCFQCLSTALVASADCLQLRALQQENYILVLGKEMLNGWGLSGPGEMFHHKGFAQIPPT